jgi:peptide/nickel transport system substrate-binding protein
MFIIGWGNATGDADYNQFSIAHSSAVGAPGNYAFLTDPEVDRLIEAGRKEQDLEKRKQFCQQAMEIQTRDAVYIPYRNGENIAAINKNVEGIWISPSGLIQLYDAKLK